MKNRRSKIGLSILAGGLSFVGGASAVELIVDGSYESSTNNLTGIVGLGGDDNAGIDGGWTHFSTYTYAAGYTQAGPPGSQQVYLRPYNSGGGSSVVNQTNSLTRGLTTAQIDGSQGQYSVSAWFSTYLGQNDYSDLTLNFLDASFNAIGSPVAVGGLAFVQTLPGGGGLRAWGKDTRTGLIPPSARYAAITTVATAQSGSPDGYVDLVSLDIVAGFVPIQATSPTPADNTSGASPGVVLGVTLQDGTAALNNSSIQFIYDGSTVSPTISPKVGVNTRVQYDPPGLLASLSTHTYKVAYNNTGGATANTTNTFTFTVGGYVDIVLPAPIAIEHFDGTAEGSLPAGWTQTNYTEITDATLDLADLNSASYATWVNVERNRFTNSFNSYLTHTPTTDYLRVLSTNPFCIKNGQIVTNLAQGRFVFGDSGYRSGLSQVLYLFSPDFNLTGQGNVHVSYHSLWEQNQNSIGAVEYSINQGATWLPVVYMIDGADVIRDTNGAVDGVATFSALRGDQPAYIDPADSQTKGTNYGAFIGVASGQWSNLGPYVSPRVNDNALESKRVELFRLPAADNQATVRFRFAHAGWDSWYFGIDEFGLYTIGSVAAPAVPAPTPATQTVAIGNSASLTVSAVGPGPFTYQWRHYGTNLPSRTNQVLTLPVVHSSDHGPYDVVVSNGGGSATSAPPAAVITTINPLVFVTGQWDFNNGDLSTIYGADLQYFDATVQGDTTFGTTTSFGIPDIAGQSVKVMHLNPSTGASPWGGYKMFHRAPPNGGGAYVNQYTLVYDIYFAGVAWRSLLQTDTGNASDGDIFINDVGGLGISGTYQGNVTAGAWHRVAFAMDLTGPGQAPVLTKFIDGVKVGNQTGIGSPDGRFALDTFALLLADNDGDINDTYVSSIQFSNGRRPDEYLQKLTLSGATADKIPGAIKATLVGSTVYISWSGFAKTPNALGLETADSPNGPWSAVVTTFNPYPAPAGPQAKYYRPALHLGSP